MNESILSSIKALLGIEDDYTVFDQDLVIQINTAISVLYQLGLETAKDYRVIDDQNNWSELMGDYTNVELLKTIIYLRTKKVFDPPQSQTLMSAIDSQIHELEWRLNIEVDNGGETNG